MAAWPTVLFMLTLSAGLGHIGTGIRGDGVRHVKKMSTHYRGGLYKCPQGCYRARDPKVQDPKAFVFVQPRTYRSIRPHLATDLLSFGNYPLCITLLCFWLRPLIDHGIQKILYQWSKSMN